MFLKQKTNIPRFLSFVNNYQYADMGTMWDQPVGRLEVVVADFIKDLLQVGDGLPRLLL
jgi:hypothetical protein